jgi:Lysyl oxidase
MRARNLRAAAVTLGALLLMGVILPLAPAPVAAKEGDKRPDLEMLTLRDWHIQNLNGRRLLRFTSIFVNAGPGSFEVRGERDSFSDPTMDIKQRMFRWDGSSRFIDTDAVGIYAADGHDHWHVQGVTVYEAWKLNDPQDTQRRGGKIGFCFLDSQPWNFSLPHARRSSYYRESWCGSRGSLTNRVGLSVGWADDYPWWFTFQWIDITGLPGGTYQVRVTVDIQDYYQERDDTDNCVWTRIRIPAPGTSNTPTVEASGRSCGVNAITAVKTFPGADEWRPPMQARIQPGTYSGYRFNSVGTVLRTKRITVRETRIVTVPTRATPPGASHRYLYTTSGPFDGYWVRPGNGIRLLP